MVTHDDLKRMTVRQLKARIKQHNITGYGKMRKAELIRAIALKEGIHIPAIYKKATARKSGTKPQTARTTGAPPKMERAIQSIQATAERAEATRDLSKYDKLREYEIQLDKIDKEYNLRNLRKKIENMTLKDKYFFADEFYNTMKHIMSDTMKTGRSDGPNSPYYNRILDLNLRAQSIYNRVYKNLDKLIDF